MSGVYKGWMGGRGGVGWVDREGRQPEAGYAFHQNIDSGAEMTKTDTVHRIGLNSH